MVPVSIRAKNAAAGTPPMPPLFAKAAAMSTPRLIRPHLAMYLLHPSLLANTAKVTSIYQSLRKGLYNQFIHRLFMWLVIRKM